MKSTQKRMSEYVKKIKK